MKTQFRHLLLAILKLFHCVLSFLYITIFTITSFNEFFSADFFVKSTQKKHTFNCLYNANLFKTSCSTPFQAYSMSRTDYCAAIVARSPVIALFLVKLD